MVFHLYKDRLGQYRWYLQATNGKKIADSGEGYYNKSDAEDMIAKIQAHVATSDVVDDTRALRYA